MSEVKNPDFEVRGNRVLIRPIESDKKTKSGLILSKQNEDMLTKGTVISTGDGRWEYGKFVENTSQVGDVVYFEKHLSKEIVIDEDTYFVVPDNEIIGVFTNVSD